jgi:aspartate oxidase
MRGGQYINNWRMAELHAKEAPSAKELEAWGALFDRTPGRTDPPAQLRGHRYPRLAHVGDRTGLELIRTLQDHGVHQGVDVHMECTVATLLKEGERAVGAFAYDRERAVQGLQVEGRRVGDWRRGPRVQDHVEQLGVLPATDTRSPTTPARRSRTWSSCTIRRG